MGCFSYTCSISGSPIEWNTPIRFMALASNPNDGAGYEQTIDSPWQPLTFAIRGRYNDYGSIEEMEAAPVTDAFFQTLNLCAVEREVGENSVHDIAVKRGMPNKDWLRALWEGRVQVKGRLVPVVSVAQAIIRDDVWQFLVASNQELLTERAARHQLRRQLEHVTRIDRDVIHDPKLGDAVLELNAVCLSLRTLGRPWAPGTCCGPQFPEWRFQLAFMERLTAVARNEVERIDADEHGEVDDEA